MSNEWEEKRLDYDLNENSIYFDIGGYCGDFCKVIHDKFHCKCYIFEPIDEYYSKIVNKFKDISNVKIFNSALLDHNGKMKITKDRDASSLYNIQTKLEIMEVDVLDIEEVIKNENITNIDLMGINIEGAEYQLLEYMISKNIHLICKNIQIQFHGSYVENPHERRDKIIDKLKESGFNSTFSYPFIWENFQHD